jgi:serine/threonine protein kinase
MRVSLLFLLRHLPFWPHHLPFWLPPFIYIKVHIDINHVVLIMSVQLHNYILIEKLGEGGFARVYKAKHKHIDKIVAIKIVKKGEFNTLQHESRVLLYLNSYYMNVFPLLHWFGRYGNLLCLATTYYSNNLRDFLHNSHQSLFYDTIKQMIDLCKKLHTVHIIHGDIKPDNFMINDK